MTIVIALQCDTSPWELSEALRGNFLIGRSVQQCHTWKYEMLSWSIIISALEIGTFFLLKYIPI